jgi:hypothetical protein
MENLLRIKLHLCSYEALFLSSKNSCKELRLKIDLYYRKYTVTSEEAFISKPGMTSKPDRFGWQTLNTYRNT